MNEPLTTARFCGLYGHWYPHRRDDAGFVRALLGQCRGIAQAMAAIRAVNPAATLVQTEDLGYVHAAPALAYQAEFENQRRWLSFDLLCGRVDRGHPLYEWLRGAGAEAGELRWFHDHPVPPDVFGLNYYVTSERFLDDDLAAWPSSTHGGNHRERYADVAAIHAVPVRGVTELLTQVWERYRRPVAITEAHLGCTREEQLRWLVELWQGADAARAAGVPVSAVTVWALLGSFDWHCLVTRDEGRYESGVFDLRGPTPRPTALATVVRALAAGQPAEHPVLGEPGWWRREAPIRTRASEAA